MIYIIRKQNKANYINRKSSEVSQITKNGTTRKKAKKKKKELQSQA